MTTIPTTTAIPEVNILLSTFNGEKFLRPLFDSLLRQDYPKVRILVRDDGSTDGTAELLGEWEGLPGVTVERGENLGFVQSFFRLLADAPPEASFFAFCDQDDIWQKDKISRAVDLLRAHGHPDQPALYCGRSLLVAEDLSLLGPKALPRRGPSFASALVQNIATGCTVVLNAAARQLLVGRLPKRVPSHDWWCYLVMSALGRVIYDPEPKVLYRQHAANVVGHKTRVIDKLSKRLVGKGLRKGACRAQAEEFRRLFGDRLETGEAALLQRFLAPKPFCQRAGFAFSGEVHGQSWKDDLKIKMLIALNYL